MDDSSPVGILAGVAMDALDRFLEALAAGDLRSADVWAAEASDASRARRAMEETGAIVVERRLRSVR